MLLSLIRKHAQSWLIKVIIFLIAVVFVLYFGTMRDSDRNAKTAMVNGELITTQKYKKAYFDLMDAFQRQYKDLWNDDLIKALNVKNMALDNLISQILIEQEAKRLGLEVTEEEIQNAVLGYSAFQVDGQFDMGRYQDLLGYKRMTPEEFEEILRQEQLSGKFRQFLTSFSAVTDQEVQDSYTYNNEKIKISFVQFKPDDFKDSVSSEESGIKDFFEEHKEQYRVPRKIKLAYLEINPKSFEGDIEISEPKILSYYEYNADTFSEPKKVRARHILFKLDEKALEEKEKQVREKAESVLNEAQEGKDFAELAKKYSEGPTKTKGGDLGYFSSGQMVKPFEAAAFDMKPGEISELVRSQFGYHIIKVEDVKEASTKPLDEVRTQITETLVGNASADLAYEKGQTLIDQMPYDTPLAGYAEGHNLEPAHTDFLAQSDPIPVIGGDQKLIQSVFSLEKNEISALIELNGKFYIFQVEDLKESYLPEMEAATDKVMADFKDQLAAEAAKSEAKSFLAQLKEGTAWEELAKEKQLKVEETAFFTRQSPVPTIGYVPELQGAVFRLNENNRYPNTVFENNKGAFVVRWEAYEGIDEETYQREKDAQRLSLMQKKHMSLFETWLENLKENADIKIITPP
ncbi:MAG: SurA N-terminal domain-containing protein [Deltaproteobacteria bacterium]|nr:SurA N-terminal domain-containing protein [Deltaproteobacteria bacterium]